MEAKNKAKSKLLIGCKKKHKDDIALLEMLFCCDDCELIKKIENGEIELIPDNNFIEENNYPDCYDYQKIDITQRSYNLILAKKFPNYLYWFSCS